MRQVTLEDGSFTIAEIATRLGLPRSTVQDWVKRLEVEGCVAGQVGSRGRYGARFVAISAMPRSTCRRVFTTIDGDEVAIFHKCLSSACAGFCGYHHRAAGGVIESVERDGNLLRETARVGRRRLEIGLPRFRQSAWRGTTRGRPRNPGAPVHRRSRVLPLGDDRACRRRARGPARTRGRAHAGGGRDPGPRPSTESGSTTLTPPAVVPPSRLRWPCSSTSRAWRACSRSATGS